MLRIRFTALSLLLGAALFAPPPLFAQTVTDSYVAGTGNDSITVKHLLKAVLVGNNNSTNDTAQLLSNFVVVGNENTIGTAAVVLGNNNAQTSLIPDTASASVQVGRDNAIEGETNTQLGLFNRTKGVSNATTGMSNVVEGDYNLVTGNVTRVTGTGNAVTGWGGQVDGSMNVKNGPGGAIRGDNNVTVGNSVEITGNNQVVIGLSARGFADGCVAIGSNSQCFESNEFSVGLINNERRVTNVAPGLRSADAANVGQLRSVALAYGAGADVINGVFVAPLIEFRNGASYTNVADALYDLDGRVTSGGSSGPGPRGADGLSAYEVALANGFQGNESDWLASLKGESGAPGAPGSGSGSTVKGGANVEVTTNTDGTQTVAVSDNVQLSDAGSVSVGATTVNAQGVSIEGGASVTTAGINAGNQRVTNVQAGRVEPLSTDAVNGGQLWDAQQAWNDRWTDTDRRLRHQDRRINALGAQLGAMSQMATAAAQNGGTAVGQVNLNAGVGFSGGEAAVSIGWGARVSERTSVSAGVSFGSGNKPVAGFGISINLGR
ncbi:MULTISPECIES: YadA-like family protein [Stenotrophomonas]|uniref:YadA-like family protein n=1 Tax=Stenotrophomonas TaxID=40323 RepID=UPI0031BB84AE